MPVGECGAYELGKVFTSIWSIAKAVAAMLRAASACDRAAHPWPTAAQARASSSSGR